MVVLDEAVGLVADRHEESQGGVVAGQHLGVHKVYYEPTQQGLEARIAERLAEIRARHHGRTGGGDRPG